MINTPRIDSNEIAKNYCKTGFCPIHISTANLSVNIKNDFLFSILQDLSKKPYIQNASRP